MRAIIALFNSWKTFHRLLAAITILISLILLPTQRSAFAAGTECSSSAEYEVRRVTDNTWVESTINHTNAPPMDIVTAGSGSFGAGVWTTVDITSLVAGDGTYNFALTTTSGTAFSLASRDAGAKAPQLVIETIP